MNILLVVEKPSVKELYKKVIRTLDIDFKVDIDVIHPVIQMDDGLLLLRERNGYFYCANKRVDGLDYANFSELGIPPKTFLCYNTSFAPLKYEKSSYDMIVGACDPDACGVLGFYKYTKERNIKDAKWVEVKSLSDFDLKDVVLNLKTYTEDFKLRLDRAVEELSENNFKSLIPRGTNGFDLFMETCDKFGDLDAFSEYFGIPYQTTKEWMADGSSCPKYLHDLMEYRLLNEGILCGDKKPVVQTT